MTLREWIDTEIEYCRDSKKSAHFPATESYWEGRIRSLQKTLMYMNHVEIKELTNE